MRLFWKQIAQQSSTKTDSLTVGARSLPNRGSSWKGAVVSGHLQSAIGHLRVEKLRVEKQSGGRTRSMRLSRGVRLLRLAAVAPNSVFEFG